MPIDPYAALHALLRAEAVRNEKSRPEQEQQAEQPAETRPEPEGSTPRNRN
ncbi:hypothetical protein [Streptomyces sp. NBC_01304]|uniref:hypothetical protein n=1 Tax=Streptomyces sp. NBC_01304 TaxID=2903818 RepID=UPI002E124B80|nr:hypothetical protein OG430_25765 [Streptomyces sp. NBC_01304]